MAFLGFEGGPEREPQENRELRNLAASFVLFGQFLVVGIVNKYTWGATIESFGVACAVAAIVAGVLFLCI